MHRHADRVRLELGELTLRGWHPDDAPALAAAVADSIDHLRPWMPWIAFEPVPIEQRRALLQRWAADWTDGGDLVCGLFLGPEVVGGGGLHRRIGPGGLDIGYWIHAAHLHRGYATRMAAGLISLAFTLADVSFVEVHHDAVNVASEAVPRRLGFVLVGDEVRERQAPAETGVGRVWRMQRDEWDRR
ncbi:MAG: GNAT family N-acetyltransferase [Candidatus Dormibacteraeota bacterium]|uniref:GNAT family N-acetyltransferase n=1 Tax=Candidatus Amunia macphersoniae TaxID=3127014 RepID=A0A934KGL2_9BACT|nr:GNAT family N-acetyltransferase [Candidatus Dormibacteraeota bacterium]